MTPLQTLLDERAKEFDEKFSNKMMPFDSVTAAQAGRLKAHDQESILKGVRLGLAMGRETVSGYSWMAGIENEDDYKRMKEQVDYTKRQIIAALEAKEKELGV